MSYSEKKLRELEIRNKEMEGIIADQNVELLELKEELANMKYDMEHETIWPPLEER